MELESPFLFVTLQPGAEPLLKDELTRELPRLRFAFSRPGFITFKDKDSRPLRPDFELPSVFARAYGLSIGTCKSVDPISEAVDAARDLHARAGGRLRLHVWERPQHVPGEEPPGFEPEKFSRAVEERLRSVAGELFHPAREAQAGDLVLDVVVMESTESSPLFLGFHRHSKRHVAFPGGEIPVEMPESSPSRAFIKMEQAIRWGRLPLRSGDTAMELGSAPGGASYALLLRELEVWGIDPGAMDPVVWTDPGCGKRFHHVKKAFSEVVREDLPEQVQWIALDINGPVRVSLPYIEELVPAFEGSLLGVILTFKINDLKHVKFIPEWIQRLEALGLRQVRATQLAANRREICVVALTRRGLLR